jgi:hypothetical protein
VTIHSQILPMSIERPLKHVTGPWLPDFVAFPIFYPLQLCSANLLVKDARRSVTALHAYHMVPLDDFHSYDVLASCRISDWWISLLVCMQLEAIVPLGGTKPL